MRLRTDLLGPAAHLFGRRRATGQGRLLAIRFLEFTRPATKFEDGDFALATFADTKWHDRRADARANVDRAGHHRAPMRLARAVQAVYVLVAADLAHRDLIEARHSYLAAVGVSGQHQRDAVRPQMVGLLGDVGQRKRRKIAAQAGHRLVDAGVAGVGIVETDDLQALPANGDDGAVVAQNFDATPPQRRRHLVGASPVVMVAQHADHGRAEGAHQLDELVEIELAVADEIPGNHHQVRALGVGQSNRLALNCKRCHPAHMLVREVRDANRLHGAGIRSRAGEPPHPYATGACRPRIQGTGKELAPAKWREQHLP